MQARVYMLLLVFVTTTTLAVAWPAHAIIVGPYLSDGSTVHLWHLDEAAGSGTAANAVAGKFSLISADGDPASSTEATITTLLGATGASGFGNAANISAADLVLGYDGNNSGDLQPNTAGAGAADSILISSITGANGAFTLEALVNVDAINTAGIERNIITMENGGLNTLRPFQFRIFEGNLQFVKFDTGSTVTISKTIPTAVNDPDAFAANSWFHAAVSYDGAGALAFYWTRVDPSRTEANPIGTGTMADLVGTNGAVLTIGNENRTTMQHGLRGLIDEVRISNIARGADDFIFAVPEPSSLALLGMAGAVLFSLGRRRRRSCGVE